MLYPVMLFSIGFLTAGLLMAILTPLIHERAVRLTVRRLTAKRPRSAMDRRAHEDQLRAQFAVTALRLETAMREAQAKAAGQLGEVAKRAAEIQRLKTELRKLHIVILRFQGRELMRRSVIRTVVRIMVYLFARQQRQDERERPAPRLRRADARKPGLGAASA
jgi:hypothetical protein